MARPSKYKPEFAEQTVKLCALGATDEEVASFFEVNIATLYRWKHTYPEFCEALKTGKEAADERVERSLFMRAVGYKAEAVKIFMPAGAEEPVYAPYIENIQPDTTAAIFWLKNRRPEVWREKREVDVTHGKRESGQLTREELFNIATGGSAGVTAPGTGSGKPN